MKKTLIEKTADKLFNAFVNNKIISPLPTKFTKKLSEAQKLRKLCESKVKDPIIGFKAAGTGIPVMKKLKEKKPFYASIFKKNFIKSGKKVKINKSIINSSELLKFTRDNEKLTINFKKLNDQEVNQKNELIINFTVSATVNSSNQNGIFFEE